MHFIVITKKVLTYYNFTNHSAFIIFIPFVKFVIHTTVLKSELTNMLQPYTSEFRSMEYEFFRVHLSQSCVDLSHAHVCVWYVTRAIISSRILLHFLGITVYKLKSLAFSFMLLLRK